MSDNKTNPMEPQTPEEQTASVAQETQDAANDQNSEINEPDKSIKIPFTSMSFNMPDMSGVHMPHYEPSDATKRLQEIISVLTKHGAIQSLASQKNPENVRLAFEELGPTFIKIGQMLSTRTDMVTQEFADELKKLQSSVKADPFDVMKPLIETYAGMPIDELFLSFDETPLASASIAQVYKGVLKNGTPVIAKIQHPGIAEKMLLDISLLEKAVPLIKFIPAAKCIEPSEIVAVLKESLLNELDFDKEAENIEVFHKNNSAADSMRCLRVYREFSNQQLLIMEYMEGNDIGIFANNEHVETEKKSSVGSTLADNYMKQIFSDGFFHADPHPGNILVNLSDGNFDITYLDFGMVGKLDDASIKKLNELLVAIASEKTEDITKSLISICRKRGKVNDEKLNADVEESFGEYYNKPMEEVSSASMFGEISGVCSDNNLILPQNLTLVFKGIVTIEGIAIQLNPSISIRKLIAPYVEKYMLSQFNLLGEIKKYIGSVMEAGNAIPKIPVQVSELIEQTKQGNLKVAFEHKGLDHVADRLESAINRLTMGLIVAAIIIGSAFLVRFNTGLVGIVASNLGAIGFLIAIMIGISMLWSSFRKKRKPDDGK